MANKKAKKSKKSVKRSTKKSKLRAKPKKAKKRPVKRSTKKSKKSTKKRGMTTKKSKSGQMRRAMRPTKKSTKKRSTKKSKKPRGNPAKTKAGRVLRIENCPPQLASKLLRDRKAAIDAGMTPPTRYGKCDYRAAEWALQLAGKHNYQTPAGMTGEAARGHWWDAISKLIDGWW